MAPATAEGRIMGLTSETTPLCLIHCFVPGENFLGQKFDLPLPSAFYQFLEENVDHVLTTMGGGVVPPSPLTPPLHDTLLNTVLLFMIPLTLIYG